MNRRPLIGTRTVLILSVNVAVGGCTSVTVQYLHVYELPDA